MALVTFMFLMLPETFVYRTVYGRGKSMRGDTRDALRESQQQSSNLPRKLSQRTLRIMTTAMSIIGAYLGWALGYIVGDTMAMLLMGGLGFVVGLLLPRYMYIEGWPRKVVNSAKRDSVPMLRTVFVLSSGSGTPVFEGMRAFAESWQAKSEIAQIILACPTNEDPIEYLAGLEIPGNMFSTIIITLKQAKGLSQQRRVRLLKQQLQSTIRGLESDILDTIKRRQMASLLVGVVMLLPTLLLAVLAPSLSSAFGILGDSGI